MCLDPSCVQVSWRAKLQNVLPVDIELLAGGDDGAMDGAPRSRRMGALTCAVIPSGEHAELPIDELPELLAASSSSSALDGGGGVGRLAQEPDPWRRSQQSSCSGSGEHSSGSGEHITSFRQLAERAIFAEQAADSSSLMAGRAGSSRASSEALLDVVFNLREGSARRTSQGGGEGAGGGSGAEASSGAGSGSRGGGASSPFDSTARRAKGWRLRLRLRVCSPSAAWRWSPLLELRMHLPPDRSAAAAATHAVKKAQQPQSRKSGDSGGGGGGTWTLHAMQAAEGGEGGGGEGDGCGGGSSGDEAVGARVVTLSLGSSCTAQLGIDPKANGRAPILLLWSPYWLINKTGLRLAYHLQRAQQQLSEPSFDTADASS